MLTHFKIFMRKWIFSYENTAISIPHIFAVRGERFIFRKNKCIYSNVDPRYGMSLKLTIVSRFVLGCYPGNFLLVKFNTVERGQGVIGRSAVGESYTGSPLTARKFAERLRPPRPQLIAYKTYNVTTIVPRAGHFSNRDIVSERTHSARQNSSRRVSTSG